MATSFESGSADSEAASSFYFFEDGWSWWLIFVANRFRVAVIFPAQMAWSGSCPCRPQAFFTVAAQRCRHIGPDINGVIRIPTSLMGMRSGPIIFMVLGYVSTLPDPVSAALYCGKAKKYKHSISPNILEK